jgi:hypothetical protein
MILCSFALFTVIRLLFLKYLASEGLFFLLVALKNEQIFIGRLIGGFNVTFCIVVAVLLLL